MSGSQQFINAIDTEQSMVTQSWGWEAIMLIVNGSIRLHGSVMHQVIKTPNMPFLSDTGATRVSNSQLADIMKLPRVRRSCWTGVSFVYNSSTEREKVKLKVFVVAEEDEMNTFMIEQTAVIFNRWGSMGAFSVGGEKPSAL